MEGKKEGKEKERREQRKREKRDVKVEKREKQRKRGETNHFLNNFVKVIIPVTRDERIKMKRVSNLN